MAGIFLLSVRGWSEYRIWTSAAGRSIEAEFLNQMGGDVCLKRRDGRTLKVPVKKLSVADQKYIEQHQLPTLKLTVHPNINRTNKAKRRRRQIQKETFAFEIKVEKTSSIPYSFPLKGDLYVIGYSSGTKSYVILQHQSISFSFAGKEREKKFKAQALTIWAPDRQYTKKPEYYGYLVVIRDTQDLIVATASNRKLFEEKADFFKGIKLDRRFNSKFKLLPTKKELRKKRKATKMEVI